MLDQTAEQSKKDSKILRKYIDSFNFRSILFAGCFLISQLSHAQLQTLDHQAMVEFTEHRKDGPTEFYQGFSNSANYVSIGIPAILLATGSITHDSNMKQKGLQICESIAISSAATWLMKYTINRQRPFQADPSLRFASNAGSPSFPSGHTSEAFASATALSLAYPKWYVIAPAYAWAGTVAYSRMYLGVHYPSDIAMGALVGIGSAWITKKVNDKWQKHKAMRKLIDN